MAKFCGKIGYGVNKLTSPGVYKSVITERIAYGDILKNNRRLEQSGGLNDNITVSNQISIVMDPYASQNFHLIKYAKFMGTAWKVINAEVQYPRLILTLGGIYNGQQA
jgi:hypothetical protein